MTPTSAGARAPRSLAGDLPGWASGLVTGALAAAVSWLVVVAPTLAALASAPDDGAALDWGSGMAAATRIWLLALGVPVTTSIGVYSLVPLGLTLLIAGIAVATAQRFLLRSWDAVVLAILSFAAVAGFAASLVFGGTEELTQSVTRAVLGALAIGIPSIVLGRVRAYGLTIDAVDRVPLPIRTGVRVALAALALAIAAAAVVGAISAFMGAGTMAQTVTELDAGGVGAGVLAIAQLAYVPTFVLWMLAWVSGVGFAVGEGSLYSPGAVEAGALPELPLLGALPLGSGGLLGWIPVLLIVFGVAARLVVHRRLASWREDALACAAASALIFTAAAVLLWLSTGAVGPGRLAHVGPSVGEAAGAITGLVALGYVLVAGVTAVWRAWRARGQRSTPAVDDASQPPVGSEIP